MFVRKPSFLFTAFIAVSVLLLGSSVRAVELDVNQMSRWADDYFGQAYQEHRFSGLVFQVVKDNEVVIQKTWGVADEKGAQIDPDHTRFLIGSMTKTFTATAIAKLYQDGLITSLDDPANKYLKRIKLEDYQGRPILVRHLLTHSAGYEQKNARLGTFDSQPELVPATEAEKMLPALVREPGELVSYSNFSTGALGFIVEDVSGQSTEDYLNEKILSPLGITSAGFENGLQQSDNVMRALKVKPEGTTPMKWLPFHPFAGPIGGMGITPNDIARYMQFQIAEGRNGSDNILSEETFKLLHGRSFSNHPFEGISGIGMKFWTNVWNGERRVEHGGSWPGHNSLMVLMPDSNLGFYVGIVGSGSPSLTPFEVNTQVSTALLGERRFEYQQTSANLSDYVGLYRNENRNISTLESILSFMGGDVAAVEQAGDGSLTIAGVSGYRSIAPDTFWKEGYVSNNPFMSELYGFSRDEQGNVIRMTPQIGLATFSKTTPLATPMVWMPIAKYAFFVMLTAVIALLWPGLNRRTRLVKYMSAAGGVLIISLPLLFLVGHGEGGLGYYHISGQSHRYALMAMAANIFLVLFFVQLYFGARIFKTDRWGQGWRSTFAAVHFVVLSLSGAALLPVLWQINLLGWNLV